MTNLTYALSSLYETPCLSYKMYMSDQENDEKEIYYNIKPYFG